MSFFRGFRKSSSASGGDSPPNSDTIADTTTTTTSNTSNELTTATTPSKETMGASVDDLVLNDNTNNSKNNTGIQTPTDVDNDNEDDIASPEGGRVGVTEVVDTDSCTPATVAITKIKVDDELDEDPERTQLEGIVRQRDAAISALEKARQEKQGQLEQLENELENERLLQMKESLIHKIDTERIKRQTQNAEERLKSLEADMSDKAAIHEYANLIKGVAPKAGVDSQYVMKLQSQLQKAVKKMDTTTEQMKELDESSNIVIDTLTKEISDLVEVRCKTELELRKQMDVLDIQKRDMQDKYEELIQENLKTLQILKAKATKQLTIDELECELEDTDNKLNELHRIQEKQQKTLEQLNKSLQQHQQEVM